MTFTELDAVVFSTQTERFLEQLDRLSNTSLAHRNEIGILLELSRGHDRQAQLAELAFGAKACWRMYSIMQRIGPVGEGYDRLMSEFHVNTVKLLTSLRALLEYSSDEVREHFDKKFFTSTPASFQTRIELFHDISWIKNWSIDHNTDMPL